MRQAIRQHTRRDIKVLQQITGLKEVRYEDIVFLKRMVREVLLSQDQNNIQMLKCFTIQNTLEGLC
jgi:hypothetical protein